jgi:4-diphosphocytidyl-2-C-methyl-D-erythritol kinase
MMQELAFGDLLQLTDMPDGCLQLYCDDPALPTGEGNLAFQAAALLKAHYAPARGASLTLRKRIPVAAGLGGGSSNAAAVLKGLNKLWNLNLPLETLQELAARLGSDVPFFLYGGTALAAGRGEIITSLPPLPPVPVLLVSLPGQALSTPLVYRSLHWDKIKSGEVTGNLMRLLMEERSTIKDTNDWVARLNPFMVNDLERGAFALAGNLAALKKELQQMGLIPLLSGSGPTFFAFCPDSDSLPAKGAKLSAKGYRVIVTAFSEKPGVRSQASE